MTVVWSRNGRELTTASGSIAPRQEFTGGAPGFPHCGKLPHFLLCLQIFGTLGSEIRFLNVLKELMLAAVLKMALGVRPDCNSEGEP
jgi:hypothetical protein